MIQSYGEFSVKTTSGDIYHHGILGMKWGVRRYQNEDGSLTAAGRKRALRTDKQIRRDLELKAYDSARFAKAYSKKAKTYSKKYEKAISKDPEKIKNKTQRIENTKNSLDAYSKAWNQYNSENVNRLRTQVDQMINKYSDKKISSIDSKMTKDGIEFIKSFNASLYNSNVTYELRKYRSNNTDFYSPVKVRHYTYVY